MWAMIVRFLARMGMGMLGSAISATAEAAKNAGLDDPAFQVLIDLVTRAQVNPALAGGDAKFSWVFAQAESYFRGRVKELSTLDLEQWILFALKYARKFGLV